MKSATTRGDDAATASDLVQIRVARADGQRRAALEGVVRAGLTASQRRVPSSLFYDEAGSQLFDEITRLEEYYPTRAERSILAAHAAAIAELAGAEVLAELGSGTSEKTRFLLDAMARTGRLSGFAPLDVSEETLRGAADTIAREYGIPVSGVVGDFLQDLAEIPREGRRLVAFLGGTIGNLEPPARHQFLVDLGAVMSSDEWLLLGTDLVKERERLRRAYDDRRNVTAAFNKNVLSVLNTEFGADFDLASFDHVALWNEERSWIEMRLRSRHDHVVDITDLELSLPLRAGEEILTEISAKFTPEQVEAELAVAGFAVGATYTDEDGDFLLTLAHPSRRAQAPAPIGQLRAARSDTAG